MQIHHLAPYTKLMNKGAKNVLEQTNPTGSTRN